MRESQISGSTSLFPVVSWESVGGADIDGLLNALQSSILLLYYPWHSMPVYHMVPAGNMFLMSFYFRLLIIMLLAQNIY